MLRRTVPVVYLVAILCLSFGPSLTRLGAEPPESARQLYAERRLPEVVPVLEARLAAEPADYESRLLLAKVQRLLDRPADALATLEPVRDARPDDVRLAAELGAAHLHRARALGSGPRALLHARRGREALERAVALDPRDYELRAGLVEFHLTAPRLAGGRPGLARPHAEAAASADAWRGNLLLAHLLLETGQAADALAAARLAQAAEPEHPAALLLVGRAHLASGDTAAARLAYEQALALDPDHHAAREALAALAPTVGSR